MRIGILTVLCAVLSHSVFAADMSLVSTCTDPASKAIFEVFLAGRDDSPESIVVQTVSYQGKVFKSASHGVPAQNATGIVLQAPGLTQLNLILANPSSRRAELVDARGSVVAKLNCL